MFKASNVQTVDVTVINKKTDSDLPLIKDDMAALYRKFLVKLPVPMLEC